MWFLLCHWIWCQYNFYHVNWIPLFCLQFPTKYHWSFDTYQNKSRIESAFTVRILLGSSHVNWISHLEYSSSPSSLIPVGNGSFIIALSVGSAVIVIISAALVYLLHRRRQNSGEGHTTLLLKRSPVNEIPFTFKKSSAVKSSQTPPGPTLKKSPTGCRSPPGGNVCISPVSPKG